MTALDLFTAIGERLPQELYREFKRRDFCIFATKVTVEVGRYFGIEVQPLVVKLVLYNKAFRVHVDQGDLDVFKWAPIDGSHSVGIGLDKERKPNSWNNHLIAVSGDVFGDFTIGQAERIEKDIHTGTALVGPYRGPGTWQAINEYGTVAEYKYVPDQDQSFRRAPDWKRAERHRPFVAKLIREIR